MDAEHKHNFVASDTGDEPGPTFDRALSKMEQQIRKYKEKLQDHRRDKPLNELAEVESGRRIERLDVRALVGQWDVRGTTVVPIAAC